MAYIDERPRIRVRRGAARRLFAKTKVGERTNTYAIRSVFEQAKREFQRIEAAADTLEVLSRRYRSISRRVSLFVVSLEPCIEVVRVRRTQHSSPMYFVEASHKDFLEPYMHYAAMDHIDAAITADDTHAR